MARVGDVIRNRRLELELTQEDLAERTGFEQSYISKVEVGRTKRPLREYVLRFAEALDMHPDELLIPADYAPLAQRVATDGELGTSGSVEFRVIRGGTIPGAPPPGATTEQWEQFWLNYPGDPPEEAVAGIEAVRRRRKESQNGNGR